MIAAVAVSPPLAAVIVAGPAAQDPTPEEAAAYKLWFDANGAKDYPKAMELAKAYLAKFPNGNATNVAFLKKWIPQVRGMQFKQAADAKNMAEIIRVGKEVLAEDPDNLDYLLAMIVQIRTNELFANPPNFSHTAEAADFAERAIRRRAQEMGFRHVLGADSDRFAQQFFCSLCVLANGAAEAIDELHS